MKQDINGVYQETLRQMVKAQEQMFDFIEMVRGADDEGKVSRDLRLQVEHFDRNIYDQLKSFLQDATMSITSSDIQKSIDELEDDDEEEDEDE